MLLTNIVFGSAFIATVAAHGHMLGDAAWINGENMKKACGETIYGNLAADENGPAELQAQMRDRALKEQGMDAKKCDNFQCRGYQPEDNVDRLQHYEVGQEVTQTVIITAPHPGNLVASVIDFYTNETIVDNLAEVPTFGKDGGQFPVKVTIPDCNKRCADPKVLCVIRYNWFSPVANQSYLMCVSYTIGDGSSVKPPPEGGDPIKPPPEGGDPIKPPPNGANPTKQPEGGDPVKPPPNGANPTKQPEGGDPVKPPPKGDNPTKPPPKGYNPTKQPKGGNPTKQPKGGNRIKPSRIKPIEIISCDEDEDEI